MKRFIEWVYEQEILVESPNISKRKTNLPCNLYASPKIMGHKHARVKVQNNTSDNNQITSMDTKNSFSVKIPTSDIDEPEILAGDTGSLKTKEIKEVFTWIKERWRILQKFWKNLISVKEFHDNVYDKNSPLNKD